MKGKKSMRMFIILLMLFSFSAKAEEKVTSKLGPVQKEVITIPDDVPDEFKGQRILIQNKDGKSAGEFDRTKWKIVPRDKKVVYRQTRTVECDDDKKGADKKNATAVNPDVMFKRHTVGLLLGYGNTGLLTTERERDLEVSQKKDVFFGAQYTYHIDYDWSVTGALLSNNSILAGAGYSFNL